MPSVEAPIGKPARLGRRGHKSAPQDVRGVPVIAEQKDGNNSNNSKALTSFASFELCLDMPGFKACSGLPGESNWRLLVKVKGARLRRS